MKFLKVADTNCDAEKSSTQAEPEILLLIVELDRDRILSMAEWVKKREIRQNIRGAYTRLLSGQVKLETWAKPGLKCWLESCPFTDAPVQSWDSATIARLIDWASQARWTYSFQLKSLLGIGNTQKPPWLESLHKIARYHSVVKSMVKLAAKQPEVFRSVQIQEVTAFNSRRFHLSTGQPHLLEAVKKLVGNESGITMEQLEKHLGTQDVEAQLRKACHLTLTLHAEMQLVVFYECNPGLAPVFQFIGTSKKACFLCHEYLLQHPLGLQALSSHQKIYPSWMPPPYYPIPGKYKSMPFVKLGNRIEQLTRRELKTALTAPRRPRNQDSTAGPSLTMTATISTDLRSGKQAKEQVALERGSLSEILE